METVVYMCLELGAEALKPDSAAGPGERSCTGVVGPFRNLLLCEQEDLFKDRWSQEVGFLFS